MVDRARHASGLAADRHNVMRLDPPTLDYGHKTRHRHWRLWLLLSICGLFGAVCLIEGKSALRWWSERQRVNRVLHAPVPVGPLALSSPSDADPPTVSAFLKAFSTRAHAWLSATAAAELDLRNATWPRQSQSPGDQGLVIIQRLQTPKGDIRIMAIGINVMITNDRSLAFMSCHVQLFEVGSFFQPHFRELQAHPSTAGDVAGDAAFANWITFTPLRYRPGASIQLAPPAVLPTDAAAIRWPINIEGRADALIFTLDENDVVHLKMESGAKLPLGILPAVPASVASTTTSAKLR